MQRDAHIGYWSNSFYIRLDMTDLESLRQLVKRAVYFGRSRYCTVCKSRVQRFKPYGVNPRNDARCPVCDALERHRFAWMYLELHTDLLNGAPKRVLHCAPERGIRHRLERIASLDYVSIDLEGHHAAVRADLTALPFDDDSFDVVLCSHVLEHVSDDRAALREIHRVMRRSGWGVLMVPIADGVTDEDIAADPETRLQRFGQQDHLRKYGRDFAERVSNCGFDVREVRCPDIVPEETARQCGLADDEIFLVRKSGA